MGPQTAYFGKYGLECPLEYNPGDYFLDVVSMDYRSPDAEADCRERVRLLADAFQQERCHYSVRLATHSASLPQISKNMAG